MTFVFCAILPSRGVLLCAVVRLCAPLCAFVYLCVPLCVFVPVGYGVFVWGVCIEAKACEIVYTACVLNIPQPQGWSPRLDPSPADVSLFEANAGFGESSHSRMAVMPQLGRYCLRESLKLASRGVPIL
ncbi:hypothetical protein F4703DRAFT_1913869 [Phycomyces blakesleeanus]